MKGKTTLGSGNSSWKISAAIFVVVVNKADKQKSPVANEASASNHGQILAWAARLRTYLEFWSRVAPLIGPPMPLARSPRATSIHASNLDVNDANKALLDRTI